MRVSGVLGCVGESGVYWDASGDSRYSGTSRV